MTNGVSPKGSPYMQASPPALEGTQAAHPEPDTAAGLEAGTVPERSASAGTQALASAPPVGAGQALGPGAPYAHLSPLERMQHAIRKVTEKLTGADTAKLIGSRALRTHVQPEVIRNMIAEITPNVLGSVVNALEVFEALQESPAMFEALLGRLAQAEAAVDRELAEGPQHPDLQGDPAIANRLALKATIQLWAQRVAEAKETAAKALALDGEQEDALLVVIQAHLLAGDLQAAHRELMALRNLDGQVTPMQNMVEALADFPRPGVALDALKADAEAASSCSLVFVVLASQGDIKGALQWLKKAAEAPEDLYLPIALHSPFLGGALAQHLAPLREQVARISLQPPSPPEVEALAA